MIVAYHRATSALPGLLAGGESGRGRVPGEPIPNPVKAGQAEAEQEIVRRPASCYGQKFQGRRTASVERFDLSGFTTAHPSLPFGSRLTVRSPASGRELAVRVTSRNPTHRRPHHQPERRLRTGHRLAGGRCGHRGAVAALNASCLQNLARLAPPHSH